MAETRSSLDQRTSLPLKRSTKNELTKIKHTGQSYDGILREMIDFWKQGHQSKEVEPGEK